MGVKGHFSTPSKEEEKYWPQVLAILIGALSALNNGLLISWPSPFLLKITQDKENYNITEDEASYFNTIQPFALIFGCAFFSKLSDVIGRKRTLLLIVIPQISSWLLAGFAKSVYVFYAARVCSGIADSCIFAVLPVYIGEVANPRVRGTWGNTMPTFFYSGELLITVIGSYFGVRTTSYICLPLPMIYLILFSMMPESPYFYIMKGRREEAEKSLKFLKRLKNVDEVYSKLERDVERQLSESGTWIDVIKIVSNRKALMAGIFLRSSQQLSGSSVFLTYTQFIFQKSGAGITHEVASILYMGVSLILNLVGTIFIVPRLGRLTCYSTSAFSCGIVLLLMGIYLYISDNVDIDVSAFNWIPVAGMMIHQVFACYGISVIPTLMLSELFSASIKSKAMTIMVMTFGVVNVITSLIFYNLNTSFGFYSPFIFFAIISIISAILSRFLIPETRGKTLEEIQQMLKKKKSIIVPPKLKLNK